MDKRLFPFIGYCYKKQNRSSRQQFNENGQKAKLIKKAQEVVDRAIASSFQQCSARQSFVFLAEDTAKQMLEL